MSSEYHTFHIHSQFTQLLGHIRRGQLDPVRDLLGSLTIASQILHLRDRNGRSALHHTADTLLPGPTTPGKTALDPKSRSSQLFDIAQHLLQVVPGLVEWQDNEGNTPLHLAVINGNLVLTKLLLRNMSRPQVNLVDYELHSAVHWATVCGELDCLAVLLEAGAQVSSADIYGAHPLHYATQSFAETHCLPPNCTSLSVRGQSALFGTSALTQQKYSTRRANGLRILHHLLAQRAIDVNCSDNEGRTPLLWAASSGNSDALLALVKAGAEISQQDKDGLSALHCASSRGHFKCAEILIMICGADVGQIDASGCTPLFYATALGHPDCVRLLIESGGEVDHQDNKGRTAAHCGASKGQLETLKILHQQGANLWIKNVRGDLPLHEAIKSGRKDLVKWLLDMNPKAINEVNLYGRSPLHIAAFNNNVELCRLLVERGADLNSVMKVRSQYLTPLDAAHQNASEEVANYLAAQGGQPIASIDQHLAEYLQTSSPIKELGARKRRQTEEGAVDAGNLTSDETEHKSKMKGADQPTANTAAYTKLPHLGANGAHGAMSAHSRTALSTASSSTVDLNGHAHTAANKLHNCREFETNLSLEKPTHLKQAIITNVYLTTAVPVGPGGQIAPVYYVKRVPPLKKGHHQMKGSASASKGASGSKRRSGGVSRSRSRSKDQQAATSMGNGSAASRSNTNITLDDGEDEDEDEDGGGLEESAGAKMAPARASVILEAHDTFESSRETRDDKLLIRQTLTTEGDEESLEESPEEKDKKTTERKVSIAGQVSVDREGEKRGKRSISGRDEDEAGGKQTEEAGKKQTETEEPREEEAAPEEVAEPLRTREDDSGFETEAKAKETKEAEAAEIEAEAAESDTETSRRKDSTTKGPGGWLKEKTGTAFEETSEFTSKTMESIKETSSEAVEETKSFFEKTSEKVRESSQKALEGTKGLVAETSETITEGSKKLLSSFGMKRGSTEEAETKEEPEKAASQAEAGDEPETPSKKRDSIRRDFVENVPEDEEAGEERKAEVPEEVSDEEDEARKKRSIGSAEEDLESVKEAPPTRKLSKVDSRASIGSIRSMGSAKSTKSETVSEKAATISEKGSRTSSRAPSLQGVPSQEKDEASREGSAKSGKSEAGKSMAGSDNEEDEAEAEEGLGGDEEDEEETPLGSKISVDEPERSTLGSMVEGSTSELGEADAEEDEDETRTKRSIDEEAAEAEIEDKAEVTSKRGSKSLADIDEVSFEGSPADRLRKPSVPMKEIIEAEVHTEEGDDVEPLREVVEEEIVPKKAKIPGEDDEDEYGKVTKAVDEDEDEDKLPSSRKGSTFDGYADKVVSDAKDEALSPRRLKSDSEAEEEEMETLKPIIAEQRRKKSVSYETAADMRSLIREPETADGDTAGKGASETIEDDEEAAAGSRKASRAKEVADEIARERSMRLELPEREYDDETASVGTFVKEEAGAKEGAYSPRDGDHLLSDGFGFPKSVKYKTAKRFEHIKPKVDSFWSGEEGTPGPSRRLTRREAPGRGSKEMIAAASGESADEQYAKINPKIINTQVQKYLRKYYLERKLFEELYDLKRYQIRTGRSNEPQAVKRLVEKFRRDVRAPGMSDFAGPFSYRAYEMYLYDQLRKLSRSNERKIAFMDKSISYEDLNSSFERSDNERGGDFYSSSFYDSSSPSRGPAPKGGRRGRATAQGKSKEDPLLDYDEGAPFGLSVDYKYEYHKSQHLDREGKELVDVICENLYKRTGVNGAKMDEVAISRKVVERTGEEEEGEGEGLGEEKRSTGKASDRKSKPPPPGDAPSPSAAPSKSSQAQTEETA